jgi:hypothetical protein
VQGVELGEERLLRSGRKREALMLGMGRICSEGFEKFTPMNNANAGSEFGAGAWAMWMSVARAWHWQHHTGIGKHLGVIWLCEIHWTYPRGTSDIEDKVYVYAKNP